MSEEQSTIRPIKAKQPFNAIRVNDGAVNKWTQLKELASELNVEVSLPKPSSVEIRKLADDLDREVGYRRFARCATCRNAVKIRICYKASSERCKTVAEDGTETEPFGHITHTHFTCECRTIVFEGDFQVKTKLDKN